MNAEPSSPRRAAGSSFECFDNLVVNMVAHQDDDILFMNPDIQRDVAGGRCVLTVFVTAGDGGRGAASWHERELGPRAAYAHMAGVADNWTRTTVTIGGRPYTQDILVDRPSVGLLFMRLPDGDIGGEGFPANRNESLKKLWDGTISTMTAVDGSASYTRAGLISACTALMNWNQPVLIRTQDSVGAFGDGDHTDHHASAYFVLAGHRNYVTPHTITAYYGYPVGSQPPNLTAAEQDEKLATFLAYAAHDPGVCQTRDQCLSGSTGTRSTRQYTTGSELGGRQNVAPLGTVTSSSQNTASGQTANKAVDGVVAGYPHSSTNEWATTGGKAGSWLNIAWPTPHTIAKVALYDRPNPNDHVTAGTLTFSDGTTVAAGALPDDGSAAVLSFTPRRVTSVRFTVDEVSATTLNVGLAELQAFSTNVAPRASVSASSENAAANQQAGKVVDGYAVGYPVDSTREWATVGGKAGSWLRLTWGEPHNVGRVVLYDRPNPNDQITAGQITFSDGSTLAVPALPNDGTGLTLEFPARTITGLELQISAVSATTVNVGLAEIQVELAD